MSVHKKNVERLSWILGLDDVDPNDIASLLQAKHQCDALSAAIDVRLAELNEPNTLPTDFA